MKAASLALLVAGLYPVGWISVFVFDIAFGESERDLNATMDFVDATKWAVAAAIVLLGGSLVLWRSHRARERAKLESVRGATGGRHASSGTMPPPLPV